MKTCNPLNPYFKLKNTKIFDETINDCKDVYEKHPKCLSSTPYFDGLSCVSSKLVTKYNFVMDTSEYDTIGSGSEKDCLLNENCDGILNDNTLFTFKKRGNVYRNWKPSPESTRFKIT